MSSTNQRHLKPCPFCGEKAQCEQMGTLRQSMMIACTNCGARVESSDQPFSDDWSGLMWNMREEESNTTELQQRIEALEAALRDIADNSYVFADDIARNALKEAGE